MMHLAIAPLKALASPWNAQAKRAVATVENCIAYAKQIGCIVHADEIIANPDQSRLLAKWWSEHDG